MMTTKSIRGEKVKGKVLTGFVLLFILTLGGIFAVIFFARQLRPPDTDVSQAVKKLTLVSNMLSGLIDADGQARAYITSGKQSYYNKYLSDQKQIEKIADSLKNASVSHTEQYLRILVVDSLLKIKHSTLESFFRLQRSSGVPILSADRLDEIVDSFNDTVATSTHTITSTLPGTSGVTITHNSGEDKEVKSNVFKRLWSGITGKKERVDTVIIQHKPDPVHFDTTHTYVRVSDTAIEKVRTQLQRMGREEREGRQLAIERELMLLRTDQSILDEIRNVLLLYEKEEINGAIAGSEKANQVLNRLWETALILALASVLIMFIFILLIWQDLAKSAFYRRQLEHARILAERLLKVKELFLANMSHEIRTPITSIIGFSERMADTQLSAEQQDYLEYITASSDHLLGLVDDLLDYSRIESGKFSLESVSFNPALVLRQSFETLRPSGEKKGLMMNYSYEGGNDKMLVGDPLRLRQIVYNLLNNSIKFTESGSVSMKVEETETDDTLELKISVSDTGIGIPQEKQNLIFEEFTQVDASITRRYGGSGLGLAIVLRLTQLMKGNIELESREQMGSTFIITLPFDMINASAGDAGETAFMPQMDEVEILLAEDDETTRRLIVSILSEAGAKVTGALDGHNAFAVFGLNPQQYDLLITDINMPGLSGPGLAETILNYCKEHQITPPVILGLTAHATPGETEKFKNYGINNLLIKPFRKSQLFAAIQTLLPHLKSGKRFADNGQSFENEIKSLNDDSSGKGYDLSKFAAYTSGDPEALKIIIKSLTSSIKLTIEQMQEALHDNDFTTLSLLAHRALPNIRNLGAQNAIASLVDIERLRNNSSLNPLEVKDKVNKCVSELEEVYKGLSETILVE
ncbi:MAG: ATP-binding protein [Lentimicrobiaceae bacterium]|jgi:hypothetical protein|nr:ATP-binding protein [Lentimicrobiaceae bacterium]MDD4598502.1 ATP-binding protein [Lentimicrobiaceae bacterium]MDY0025689.1 ATP-binding protein [Lentimicrobium sp.]